MMWNWKLERDGEQVAAGFAPTRELALREGGRYQLMYDEECNKTVLSITKAKSERLTHSNHFARLSHRLLPI
jgi:hypothetical protein